MRRTSLAARARSNAHGGATDHGHDGSESPDTALAPPPSAPSTAPWVLPALRAALDTLGVAAVVADVRGHVVLANERACVLEQRDGGSLAHEVTAARHGARSSFVVTELPGAEGHVLAVQRAPGSNVDDRIARVASRYELTRAQTRVLGYLVRGLPNRTIAGTLAISERTVEAHVTAILLKLTVDSRSAAVAKALGDTPGDE